MRTSVSRGGDRLPPCEDRVTLWRVRDPLLATCDPVELHARPYRWMFPVRGFGAEPQAGQALRRWVPFSLGERGQHEQIADLAFTGHGRLLECRFDIDLVAIGHSYSRMSWTRRLLNCGPAGLSPMTSYRTG